MNFKLGLCAVLWVAGSMLADAAEVSISPAKTGNLGWNSAIWGNPVATAPTVGNSYVDDGSASGILFGLGGTYGSFAGDKLTLGTGSGLHVKGGGNLPSLVFDGGSWQVRASGTSSVLGSIHVASSSSILIADGDLVLDVGFSCDPNATLALQTGARPDEACLSREPMRGFKEPSA